MLDAFFLWGVWLGGWVVGGLFFSLLFEWFTVHYI